MAPGRQPRKTDGKTVMPSWSALLGVAGFWLVWLLVVRRIVQGHAEGALWATTGWVVAATVVAAWLSWMRLVDDKRAHLTERDEPQGYPLALYLLAVGVLASGGVLCLLFAVLLPAWRRELVGLGVAVLMVAVVMLFLRDR